MFAWSQVLGEEYSKKIADNEADIRDMLHEEHQKQIQILNEEHEEKIKVSDVDYCPRLTDSSLLHNRINSKLMPTNRLEALDKMSCAIPVH